MKLLKYVLGGLAVTAAVGVGVVVYKWWKGRKQVRNHFAPAFEKKRKKMQLLIKPILDASFGHEQ